MKTVSQPPSLGLCLCFCRFLVHSPLPAPRSLSSYIPLVLPYLPIVKLRKLRLRKRKYHVQGHTQE